MCLSVSAHQNGSDEVTVDSSHSLLQAQNSDKYRKYLTCAQKLTHSQLVYLRKSETKNDENVIETEKVISVAVTEIKVYRRPLPTKTKVSEMIWAAAYSR